MSKLRLPRIVIQDGAGTTEATSELTSELQKLANETGIDEAELQQRIDAALRLIKGATETH